MRVITILKQDLSFQFRHKFYHAYLIISLIYIALLLNLPVDLRPFVAGIIIFSDPSMLGFLFISAIILLEKDDNILESLFVTPLKLDEYLTAKLISLGLISLLSSLFIVIVTIQIRIDYFLLISGIILTALTFTLFGVAITARIKTVNQFLIVAILFSIIIILPLLKYLGLTDNLIFYLLPSQPALLLIGGALKNEISSFNLIYSFTAALIWGFIAYKWARKSFYQHIILKR
jgi:fluoroquinolone transport system permease protein